jgi:hypothetical protein
MIAQAVGFDDNMRAAHEVYGPSFTHAILTTEELLVAMNTPRVERDGALLEAFTRKAGTRKP